MQKTNLLLGMVLVGFMTVFCGCIEHRQKNEQPQQMGEGREPALSQPTAAAFTGELVNGVREIKLEAYRYAFNPDRIVVKKGDKVRISAKSKDVTHGIKIRGYGINQQLPPNEENIIEFVADRSGTFGFSCNVFCGIGHMNMNGKLIVKE